MFIHVFFFVCFFFVCLFVCFVFFFLLLLLDLNNRSIPTFAGSGYLIYGANFYMSIEKLTPDFLYSTGQNASAGGPFGGTVFPE